MRMRDRSGPRRTSDTNHPFIPVLFQRHHHRCQTSREPEDQKAVRESQVGWDVRSDCTSLGRRCFAAFRCQQREQQMSRGAQLQRRCSQIGAFQSHVDLNKNSPSTAVMTTVDGKPKVGVELGKTYASNHMVFLTFSSPARSQRKTPR